VAGAGLGRGELPRLCHVQPGRGTAPAARHRRAPRSAGAAWRMAGAGAVLPGDGRDPDHAHAQGVVGDRGRAGAGDGALRRHAPPPRPRR
jgi:hypothetical protein